jgi:hypothetical protein
LLIEINARESIDCLFGEASKRRQGAAMMKSVFSAVAILAAASM